MKKGNKSATNIEILNSVEKLAISTATGFEDVQRQFRILDNRIGGLEIGVAKANQKIDGLASRLDDFANTRVKIDIHATLVERVEHIETKLGIKRGQ
ncbi:MAG TPA: hypothetical protein VI981_05615 [Candidatus Paceibacterota bacterium]